MRMRKKKWAEPYLEAHQEYVLPDPENYKGKWHETLQCDVLHVEIGTGKGEYLLKMSRMYPEEGWIGIEKDRSVAAVAARKAIESGTDSTHRRMIALMAENLEDWFADKEIDVLHLNFSDPWPKKKTHKKRLSSSTFLKMYAHILSDNGEIRMKTDNTALFEDSVLYFLENGFTFKEFSVDYRREEHPEDVITEYESKFMELGQPIYRLVAIKTKNNIQ